MSFFFTQVFKDALTATPTLMNAANIRMHLFRVAPQTDLSVGPWVSTVATVAELLAYPGWVSSDVAGHPFTDNYATTVRTTTIPNTTRLNRFVQFNNPYYFGSANGQTPYTRMTAATHIEAIGIQYIGSLGGKTDPLIFVTNTPTGGGVNIAPPDALTANPDVNNFPPPDQNARYLFSWVDPSTIGYDLDAADYFSTPDVAALDITGDITMVAHCAADDWTPAAAQQIIGKWDASGQFSYRLVLNATGTLQFDYTVNGTTVASRTSTANLAALANGAWKWVAVTMDVTTVGSTNEARFWTSDDGVTWTQLGTTVTVGGTAGPFFSSTSTLRVGAASGGFTGKVERAVVYNGIAADGSVGGGTIVANWVATPSSPYTDSTGKVWTASATPTHETAIVNPNEGALSISYSPPAFEPSNTVHIWLYPQRANMIANPSFEKAGVGYWATSGTLTRSQPDGAGTPWVGAVTGTAPIILESNEWDTRMGDDYEEWWTVQVLAKGNGLLKVGLCAWDSQYRGTIADWGTETWQLYTDAWTPVRCIRHVPQAYRAMLRLECNGTQLTIDKALAERGTLKDWDYFDGDSTYASPESYGWYGGAQQSHKSYSMLYGARRAVLGRLFATPTDAATLITDETVKAAGLVYQWVPAGVSVIPHVDVFYPGDLRLPPPPKSTTVYPYYNASTQPMGVPSPWV